MAMVSMEAGRTPIAPAKAFFSICFTLTFFYNQPLSKLLEEDLEVVLFWSGIVLVVLSIIPLVEWGLKASVKFFDWHLPHKATNYWETVTRSVWESFLNNTIRDLYLIGALLSIIWKTATDHDFFDQDIPGISTDTNWLIVLVGCLVLVVVLAATLYDRYLRHAGDIRLTQRYLTTISKESLDLDKQEEYYLNRAWELFRRTTIPQIKKAAAEAKRLSGEMPYWASQGPSKIDNFHDWATRIGTTLGIMYDIKPETIPSLSKRDPGNTFLDDLNKLVERLLFLPKLTSSWWSDLKLAPERALALLGPVPDWSILTKAERNRIAESTMQVIRRESEANRKSWNVTEQWVKSLYRDIAALAIRLEEYEKTTERYLYSLYNKSLLGQLSRRF